MTFIRYPHLERFGNQAVQDIEFGMCHLFPKLDGTNASIWLSDKQEDFNGVKAFRVCAGSRNRELSVEKDNAGFLAEINRTIHYAGELGHKLYTYLLDNHTHILYGEWLVPHTLKTYRDDAWRKFYVFDVYDRFKECFLPYDEYKGLLDAAGIDYVPCIQVIKNPSYDNLVYAAKNCSFLLKEGIGEGIVIKNYEWKNKYNQVTWAKIVNSEFKEENVKTFGPSVIESISNAQLIVNKVCTKTLVDKELSKIENETGGWSSRYIPRLLHTIYHAVVTEELWDCLKLINKGNVNFRELEQCCIKKVKELKPEIFS